MVFEDKRRFWPLFIKFLTHIVDTSENTFLVLSSYVVVVMLYMHTYDHFQRPPFDTAFCALEIWRGQRGSKCDNFVIVSFISLFCTILGCFGYIINFLCSSNVVYSIVA